MIRYSQHTKFRALDLLDQGTRVGEVAALLNVPRKRISDWKSNPHLREDRVRPRRNGKNGPAVSAKPIARCRECGSDEGRHHFPACSQQKTPWARDNVLRLRGEVVKREQCEVR